MVLWADAFGGAEAGKHGVGAFSTPDGVVVQGAWLARTPFFLYSAVRIPWWALMCLRWRDVISRTNSLRDEEKVSQVHASAATRSIHTNRLLALRCTIDAARPIYISLMGEFGLIRY